MTDFKLLDELANRYAHAATWRAKLFFLWKRWSWRFVVGFAKGLKRFLDIVISFFSLLALSWLFLLIAILIKATDGGPIFYASLRAGKWGKPFSFYKFRSMRVGADKEKTDLLAHNVHKEGHTFKIKEDPRITWIGRILRRWSFDELPQLYNVLKGEMSLVGPRPALVEEVAHYSLEERCRLEVTPGMTGLWQVSGRADIAFPKQVELDVAYIESQSILTDLVILLKTFPAVLLGRGAY
jgi:lipopolysaccharide/colanic/teichoic acid biosynthesis glycosyltransferase